MGREGGNRISHSQISFGSRPLLWVSFFWVLTIPSCPTLSPEPCLGSHFGSSAPSWVPYPPSGHILDLDPSSNRILVQTPPLGRISIPRVAFWSRHLPRISFGSTLNSSFRSNFGSITVPRVALGSRPLESHFWVQTPPWVSFWVQITSDHI